MENSRHFVEVMRDLRVEEDEVLVSFNMTSLFTNLPVDKAVWVRVAQLPEACLRSTYFSHEGAFYEQREGAAMGSPVSAVVANLYTEFFERACPRHSPSEAPPLEEVC